jgi:carboxymethylenebutenolidase
VVVDEPVAGAGVDLDVVVDAERGQGTFQARGSAPRAWAHMCAAARLDRALTTLGIGHDIKVYPGAGHGFINNHDPADATLLLTVLSKISGTRYHEPSANDAHRRIAAFFHRHLTT